jgi:hypothetical protein
MHHLAERLYETMATCYWKYTAGLINFERGLLVITQACPRGISGGGSLSG